MMSTSSSFISTDEDRSPNDCSPDPADMHSLKNSMGNVTDTMTRLLKSSLRLSVALVVLAGLSAGAAMAQDQYVDPVNGSNSNSGNTSSDPVATISQAITNAPPGGEIAIRRNEEYNEDVTVDETGSDPDYQFISWDGEDGTTDLDGDGESSQETGTDAPGPAVLNGDLTVGDPSSNTTAQLELLEGFTLEFEENTAVTLTGTNVAVADPAPIGSEIKGDGKVLASTSGGQFIVNVADNGSSDDISATIENLEIDKPNGKFRVRRRPAPSTGTESAILQIARATGFVSGTPNQVDYNGEPSFVVNAGNVTLEDRSDIAFRAQSSTDFDPTLNLSGAESLTSPGSQSGLILDVAGDTDTSPDPNTPDDVGESEVFTAEGDIDLGLLLRIEDAPEVGGSGSGTKFNNPAGLVVQFNEIGNGGRSFFSTEDDFSFSGENAQDQVQFSNLTSITGSFRAQSEDNDGMVDAPLLDNITGDLDIESGAAMRTGQGTASEDADPLTVGGATTIQGGSTATPPQELIVNNTTSDGGATFEGTVEITGADTDVEFNSEQSTFEKTFTLAEATADFNGAGDFQDVNFGSTLNFNAVAGGATSTVAGTFTSNGGDVNLADDTGGYHELSFNGDVVLASGTLAFDMEDDLDGAPTFINFDGSDPQAIDGSGSITGADRVRIANTSGGSPAVDFAAGTGATSSDRGEIEILDLLRLEDGSFRTNGGLDMRLDASSIDPPETAAETDEASRGEDRGTGKTALRRRLVRVIDGTGFLNEGDSESIIDGEDIAYAVKNDVAQSPYTVRYEGTGNESTGDELLPDGVTVENKSVPEFVVDMDAGDATITLDTDRYRVASDRTGDDEESRSARLELLGGELAFTTAGQLGLECRGTIQRGNGDFITEDVVEPVEALELGVDCGDDFLGNGIQVGEEGVHLEYTNSEEIIAGSSRGIEWLSTTDQEDADNRLPTEILDVRVDNTAPVTLNEGSTYRFNQDALVADGAEFDLNGQTLEMHTPDNAGGDDDEESGITGEEAVEERNLALRVVDAPGEELRIVESGALSSVETSALEFTGAGQANAIGERLDDEQDTDRIFALPEITINKELKESLPEDNVDEGDRRVRFATANTGGTVLLGGEGLDATPDTEGLDGFEINGNFEILSAQDFGDNDADDEADLQDGVELASTPTGPRFKEVADDPINRVDVFRVTGDFVQGDEENPGGSFGGFLLSEGLSGSEFTVEGSLTKASSDTSRHYVGGRAYNPDVDFDDGSVADYSVGTDDADPDSLKQENGTFYAIVSNQFTVTGGVRNSSDDSLNVDLPSSSVVYSSNQNFAKSSHSSFESEAFEVAGIDIGDYDDGGVDSGPSDDLTRALVTESVEQNAGTMLFEGFVEDEDEDGETTTDDSWVVVQGSFYHNDGVTEIPDALLAIVDGEDGVVVRDSTFRANMDGVDDGGSNQENSGDSHDNRFRTSALTVGTDGGSSGASAKDHTNNPPPADAVFEASATENASKESGDLVAPPNQPDGNDRLVLSGDTRVEGNGQYELEGYEHRQAAGGYYLLGYADFHEEPAVDDSDLDVNNQDPWDDGQCGLVRFTGEEAQALETDGTSHTFLNSLSVRSPSGGDPIGKGVQMKSDVTLNQVRCVGFADGGEGEESDDSIEESAPAREDAVFRPFGTLLLELGNIRTWEADGSGGLARYTLRVLTPEPTDDNDLVEANSADERRNGSFADTSPVLYGSEDSYVSGTLSRAIEDQSEDTGGRVTDGYIYPMGPSIPEIQTVEERGEGFQELRPNFRGLVLQTVTNHSSPGFFTVNAEPDPQVSLPTDEDGNPTLTDDGITRQGERIELELDAQSVPYMRVGFDERVNWRTFDLRMISDIGSVRGTKVNDVKQLRLIQREEGNDNPDNWIVAGDYDEDRGGMIDDDPSEEGGPNDFISGKANIIHEGVNLNDGRIIAVASEEARNPIGQTDAPLVELDESSPPVNVAVGNSATIDFSIEDPDTDPADFEFDVTDGSAASIDSDDVSFQSDGTVTFAPDTEDAEASFTDDESRLPLDQFAGSDPLTLEVRVDDGDNSDVASVGVNVDLQPGDADSDGNVGSASENAQDAQVALDEFLQGPDVDSPSELAPVAFNAADVGPDGGNGRVEPFDASLILSGDVGSGSAALAGKSAQGGEVVIGSVENGAIPLTLSEDASGIRSASVELSLDASVSDVSADLPSGWIIDHATKEDGTLRVGLAGTSALSSGQQIASIQLDGSGAKASTDLEPEGTYRLNGSDAKDVRVDIAPEEFALEGNYPNPFTQTTTIPYQLSESADVTLEVYDMLGRKIGTLVDKQQSSGQYEVNVNQSKVGQSLSSGVYIYRLEAGDFQDTGKMTVVK
jgi:hypothetical protein